MATVGAWGALRNVSITDPRGLGGLRMFLRV